MNEGFASVHAPVAFGEGKEQTSGETLDAQFAAGGGSRAIKEVVAVIRRGKIAETKKALEEAGYPALTYQGAEGRGKQRGFLWEIDPQVPSEPEEARFLPKHVLTLLVPDADVPPVIEAIVRNNRTGYHGDGKIFVCPLEDVTRIRTGEKGETAVR